MAGERSLGSLVYWFKAKNEELKRKSKESGQAIRDMSDEFDKSKRTIRGWSDQAKDSLRQVADFAQRNKEAIQTVAVAGGAALAALTLEVRKATKEHVEFTNALIGLRSIAKGTGQDINKVTKAAEDLASDGLMNVADSATGLKNLLLAGFGLEESIILMERFKDSAAFGRQGALSFGEAIVSATEGVKNGNSILVDNAGVTKNLSVMLQEAGYSAQDLGRAADDTGVRMAIFNGIVNETRHQVGDAAKLADELGGALSRTEESGRKVHRAIGEAVEGPLREMLNVIQPILERTAEWIERNKEFVGGILTLATALAGLTAGGAAWLLLIPKISDALSLFTSGPVGWTITGLTALVTAFVAVKNAMRDAQEAQRRLADSYQKQADEVDVLIEEYQDLSEKTYKTADEKQRMIDLSNQIVEILPQAAKGYDEEGNAILDVNAALREMVLLKGKELEIRSKDLEQHIRDEQKRLKVAEERKRKLQETWEIMNRRWEISGYPDQERVKELQEEYNRELRKTNAEIESITKSLENYKQQHQDIQEILSGITPEWMRRQRKTRQARGEGEGGTKVQAPTFDTDEFLNQLQKELQNIDKVAATFGDTSDVAKDKADALRRAIITLVTNGIDPTKTAMGNLVAQYQGYAKETEDAIKETYDLFEAKQELWKALADVDQKANVFGETLDTDRERLNLFRDAIIQALVNKEPIENIQDLIDEYNALKKEIDDATTAELNNKEATALLTQAQEYLYRMTGKLAPEWERFAQKLEEMAGEEGVLPEVAAQLREIADQIRGAGMEEPETNWFTDVFEEIGYKIEEAQNIFETFRDSLIDGFTDIIVKGEKVGDVFKRILDYLAEMIVKKGIVEPIVDWVLSGIGLGSAHIGALVTPAGLVHDLPDYHGGGVIPGLRSDERVIKVLTGERILSREQNKKFEAGEYGKTEVTNVFNINAVDAASFVQLVQRHPEAITSVVAGDIVSDGPLRKTIMRYTK